MNMISVISVIFLFFLSETSSFQMISEKRSQKYFKNHKLQPVRLASNSDPELNTVPGMKGFYVRPSRAVEKGGGFFVPGLEEERIRIVSAIILLSLYAINHSGTQVVSIPQTTSELVGIAASGMLLLQGISSFLPKEVEIDGSSKEFLNVQQSAPVKNLPTIEKISRALLSSSPFINYVLVLSINETGKLSVAYEIGPVSGKLTKISQNSGVLKDLLSSNDNVKGKLRLEVFSLSQFISKFGDNFCSVPKSASSVAVLTKNLNSFIWVIASSDAEGTLLTAESKWIKSLVEASFI